MNTKTEDAAKAKAPTSDKSEVSNHVKWALDFLKGIAWPLLAAIVLILYHSEIRQIITLVPKKLLAANKATIGSFSWEISQQARRQGGPALQASVGKLSAAAVTALIETGDHRVLLPMVEQTAIGLPKKEQLDSLEDLGKAGLVEFKIPLQDFLQFVDSVQWSSKGVRGDHFFYDFGKPLPEEMVQRMKSQDYYLRAFEAIVMAITSQLSDTDEAG